jgi:DNA uptake protein ComE-like DNA-binding protein
MLLRKEPPIQFKQALKNGIGDFLIPGGDLWLLLMDGAATHPVHHLDLEKVLASNNDASFEALTTPSGWRFLAAKSGVAVGCHVGTIGTEGAYPKVTGFSRESYIEGTVEFIAQLEKMTYAQGRSFELRALRIPWLKFEAFWLVSPGHDLLIPCDGFPEAAGLRMWTAYTINEFLDKVLPRSKKIRGQLANTKAAKLRARADWHKSGKQKAHEEAAELEALAQVLHDINQASAEQIACALDLNSSQGEAIYKRVQESPFRNFAELLEIDRVSAKKLEAKRHYIGFGEPKPEAIRAGQG